MLDTASSVEASAAIVHAFFYYAYSRRTRDASRDEQLQLAQVRYHNALRRLKEAFPGEFCGLPQDSPKLLVNWALRVEAFGEPLPLARRAAGKVGFDYDRAVALFRDSDWHRELEERAVGVVV